MTVKRKITSRHEVDSRPLSEWLRDAWRVAARPQLVSTTTSSASDGVYWIPKLGEELGEADMVLRLLGGILPICKMAMSFLFYLGPASGRRRGAREMHRNSDVMVKDGGELARATSIGPKGGNRF
jgi:hypothetical protein